MSSFNIYKIQLCAQKVYTVQVMSLISYTKTAFLSKGSLSAIFINN
jgi:hypothetical protein